MSGEANTVTSEARRVPYQPLELEAETDERRELLPTYISSSGESSDPGSAPTVVRQENLKKNSRGEMDEGDKKLYVIGNLGSNHLPSGVKAYSSDTEFEDDGIYQGLIMTDTQKKSLGILPESIYMTTNLLEKGDLIESLSTSFSLEVAVEVPEVPLPPHSPSLFTKDTIPLPKLTEAVSPNGNLTPQYQGLILRPPPLPPIEIGATRGEIRAHAVVENLLRSEAAYLTSLNIAIKVYKNPLLEKVDHILSWEEVNSIFGPIDKILDFQEIFYSAIISRTLDWKPSEKIGDVLSSLNTRDVVKNYSTYVNNFTTAMAALERAIKKKPKFLQFLKDTYPKSRTSLSLQGLLLKPIQRFPQYIMFLQNLIRYTCDGHPDRITLLMALARYEGIANFLNESKRQQEQKSVVQNINNKVSHLPFKLTDGKRWLHRQDIVTRLLVADGKVVKKDRCLLFFNNIVLCAAMRRRKKKGFYKINKEELESSTGSRDFQAVNNIFYTCKWHCPIDQLEVVEPDYLNDIWDQTVSLDTDSEYIELKQKYVKLEQDFSHLSQIVSIASVLYEEYTGLGFTELANHVRILQRKIAKMKEDLKRWQEGRMDIILPSRENDKQVHHTYSFKTEKVKLDWVNNLRYTKRKLNYPVESSWVIAEDTSEGDIFEVSYRLPLFVKSYDLNMVNNEMLSVQCATKVGQSCAWLASGDSVSAQVAIVECVTPTPLILECFKVHSKRIIDIKYVPPSSFCLQSDSTLTTPTMRRNSRTIKASGSLNQLPPYLATVWLGGQCGKLSIYSADLAEDGSKPCLSTIKLGDAITSLQYYRDQVFVSTADGDIVIFRRNVAGFNLTTYKTVHVVPGSAIRCSCIVGNKLWTGIQGTCYFFNMQTHKIEGSIKMREAGVAVSKMVSQGEGVWVSYKGSSSLELFHSISKISLQSIDIKASICSIIKRRKLESRLPIPNHIHVTAIMLSHGYLWIGTSVGAIMVYHIPHLESVPIVSGKPYLAMDSHAGSVRVLQTVQTMATMESSRLGQFLVDEQMRNMQKEELDDNIEPPEQEDDQDNISHETSHDQDANVKQQSVSLPVDPVIEHSGDMVKVSEEILKMEDELDKPTEPEVERSMTPSLPNPSTFILEESLVTEEETVTSEMRGDEPVHEWQVESNGEEEGGEEDYRESDDYASDEIESKIKYGHGIQSTQSSSHDGTSLIRIGLLPQLEGKQEYSIQDSDDNTISRDDDQSTEYINDLEDPYSVPKELDKVVMRRLDDEVYNNPNELETMRRFPTLEAKGSTKGSTGEEGDYDFPAELLRKSGSEFLSSVNPYEDPATLFASEDASQLLSPGTLNNSLFIPGRQSEPKEGAVFVLTAGRGLLNLRQGKRAALKDNAEGCMIAYEIEMTL